MVTINPVTVITTIDGDPWKSGWLKDPVQREELKTLRQAFYDAETDQERESFNRKAAILLETQQSSLTVGDAIIAALLDPQKGDENVQPEDKLDREEWAVKLKRAAADGRVVEFDNKAIAAIKARVNKRWPEARVVAEVFRAMTKKEAKPEGPQKAT